MKYSNKLIMLSLIGTSFFTPPACAGKHELLSGLMDTFAARNSSSIAKKFSTSSQFFSEKKHLLKTSLIHTHIVL